MLVQHLDLEDLYASRFGRQGSVETQTYVQARSSMLSDDVLRMIMRLHTVQCGDPPTQIALAWQRRTVERAREDKAGAEAAETAHDTLNLLGVRLGVPVGDAECILTAHLGGAPTIVSDPRNMPPTDSDDGARYTDRPRPDRAYGREARPRSGSIPGCRGQRAGGMGAGQPLSQRRTRVMLAPTRHSR